MRFLGNKTAIAPEIKNMLDSKGLSGKNLTFFDAFCGTGSVADYLKDDFNLVVNDLLDWCVIYTRGRIYSNQSTFANLGYAPFTHLNNSCQVKKGFFYNNYSRGGSSRMYLSEENAERVDYFRSEIEKWRIDNKISYDEYCYLLASLVDSISLVANVAGVYGAFLKHWDARALKPIKLNPVEANPSHCRNIQTIQGRIEDVIDQVECDVLYLDPPYTQNQYGTQYHLLQTLVLNDEPNISKITGSRPTGPMRSDWSKDLKAHILFDQIIAKTNAKHILLSYSTDGLMSKDYIESILKRYGKEESYECRKMLYTRYGNHKAAKKTDHAEYLFYIEKKDEYDINFESPLNYMGNKIKLINNIKESLPEDYNRFIDAFGGGFNVGINIKNKQVVYNDANYFVSDLIQSFKLNDTYQYLLYIRRMTSKFDLKKANKVGYQKARSYYNSSPAKTRDPRMLYTLLLYGFQQQLRFNSNHEFNNPVGMRWFNDKVLAKMISFSRHIKEIDTVFHSLDFDLLESKISEDDFVYLDPPYRLTLGSYNDGKRGFGGWNIKEEKRFLDFCNRLDNRGIKFMVSYVLEHGGEFNDLVKKWASENGYKIIPVEAKNISRAEVIIVNY